MWIHDERKTKICLFVDDFGVKPQSKDDADHLSISVGFFFRHTIDKDGTNYCGFTMHWNYSLGYVDVSMSNYLPKALTRLKLKKMKNTTTLST